MRVVCTLKHITSPISGVAFERLPSGDLLSEEITHEQADRFLHIKEFHLYHDPTPPAAPNEPSVATDTESDDDTPGQDEAIEFDDDHELQDETPVTSQVESKTPATKGGKKKKGAR